MTKLQPLWPLKLNMYYNRQEEKAEMVELYIAEKKRFIVFSVTTEDHTGK